LYARSFVLANTVHATIDYSIVIPVYFNEGSLESTMASIKRDVIVRNPKLKCEVIFVDDGSGDGSLNELIQIQKKNPKIVNVIKLKINFCHVSRIFTHQG
jgi:glycosyltransferase involved in cell wall biosynthesis